MVSVNTNVSPLLLHSASAMSAITQFLPMNQACSLAQVSRSAYKACNRNRKAEPQDFDSASR